MKLLLLNAPMTDVFSAYPATCYLKGFLETQGIESEQEDVSIQLALKIFSRAGLDAILKTNSTWKKTPTGSHFLKHAAWYLDTVDIAVRYLQGKEPSLAHRIASRRFFPPSPRADKIWFYEQRSAQDELSYLLGSKNEVKSSHKEVEDPLVLFFGRNGVQDRARYVSTVFLDDIVKIINDTVDPYFRLNSYAEELSPNLSQFDAIKEALDQPPTLISRFIDEITAECIARHQPDIIGISAAFTGMAYGAFRIGRFVKLHSPNIPVILGGNYPTTSLRNLEDPRVFDYVDYITYDDGERPLQCLIEYLSGKRTSDQLFRTRLRESGKVVLKTDLRERDIPHKNTGTPNYKGINPGDYLSIIDHLSPMKTIWTTGFSNKLTLAHGCYWRRCSFCDVSLDFVGRYDPSAAHILVGHIEKIRAQTGSNFFHFVDEALPPNLVRALSELLLEKKISISWMGMVRWDKAFTPELTELMSRAGCILVSGGLETPSDRLLKLMDKGTSIEQVARVTRDFSKAGIFVHAMMMYGFPTETLQETINGLEYSRQLFEESCLNSGVWHRFVLSPHSLIAKEPGKYGVKITNKASTNYSNYEMNYRTSTEIEAEPLGKLGKGLNRALNHYMHRSGFNHKVDDWFTGLKVPKPTLPKNYVKQALR